MGVSVLTIGVLVSRASFFDLDIDIFSLATLHRGCHVSRSLHNTDYAHCCVTFLCGQAGQWLVKESPGIEGKDLRLVCTSTLFWFHGRPRHSEQRFLPAASLPPPREGEGRNLISPYSRVMLREKGAFLSCRSLSHSVLYTRPGFRPVSPTSDLDGLC